MKNTILPLQWLFPGNQVSISQQADSYNKVEPVIISGLPVRDSTGNFIASQWWGARLYPKINRMYWCGLTLRSQYVDYKDKYPGLKSAFNPTLSTNFKANNLAMIPEPRFDNNGNPVFNKPATESMKLTAVSE